MELKDFFRFLNRNKKLIGSVTLAVGLITLGFSLLQPSQYEADMSVYIRREAEKPNNQFYTYDGYYSQQAAKEYTDTVVGLLKTNDISRRAIELSKLDVTPDELTKMLTVKKISSQVVSVSIQRRSEVESSQSVAAVVSAVSERVGEFSAQGDSKFLVGAIIDSPLVTKTPSYWYFYLLGGLLVGFGLGSLLSAFLTYSRA